jgi:flagellin-like protein
MKKGVSPLIATVLLLVLVVVIGAIVFTWMRGYVRESTETVTKKWDYQLRCDLATGSLAIIKIAGVERICYDNSSKTLIFSVENNMDMDVKALFVRIIDSSGEVSAGYVANSSIAKGGAQTFTYPYEDKIQRPVQVMIMPSDFEDKLCQSAGVQRENINPC